MNGRQLADRLKVSQAHVSRLRSGERLPSMELMWSISDALGWPPGEQMEAVRAKQFHVQLNERLDADTPAEQEEVKA
jgi:transcriptional regulator with XRE-family HTH domain